MRSQIWLAVLILMIGGVGGGASSCAEEKPYPTDEAGTALPMGSKAEAASAFEKYIHSFKTSAWTEGEKQSFQDLSQVKRRVEELFEKHAALVDEITKKSSIDPLALVAIIGSVRASCEQYVRANELFRESVVMIETRSTKIWLASGLLLFGGLLLAAEVIVIVKKKQGWGPNSFRLVAITLVIIMSAFVVIVGYSEKHVGPVIALFGTIAGYLLAKYDPEANG